MDKQNIECDVEAMKEQLEELRYSKETKTAHIDIFEEVLLNEIICLTFISKYDTL